MISVKSDLKGTVFVIIINQCPFVGEFKLLISHTIFSSAWLMANDDFILYVEQVIIGKKRTKKMDVLKGVITSPKMKECEI